MDLQSNLCRPQSYCPFALINLSYLLLALATRLLVGWLHRYSCTVAGWGLVG